MTYLCGESKAFKDCIIIVEFAVELCDTGDHLFGCKKCFFPSIVAFKDVLKVPLVLLVDFVSLFDLHIYLTMFRVYR